jgi:cellulose synthase/poly-beta-1,6-N-acetylglucosamine synthase-like glycosyltransferase
MKVSVLIPVYKNPKYLEDILSKLIKNILKDKEIIVIVDGELTESIREVIEKFESNIKVVTNGIRLGKVESLNSAVDIASGETLVFLDNDVELPNDIYFLSKINKEMGRCDILEMPKEGKADSLFGKVVSYDYLSGAIASLLTTSVLGKNLFLCGSAFAIKKETFLKLGKFSKVINEDWQLALKSLSSNVKFSYPTDLKVKTLVPNNIFEWINQRKKWALGMKYWWRDIFINIGNYIKHLPAVLLVGVVLFSSAIVGGGVWLFFSLPETQLTIFNIISQLGIPLGVSAFIHSYLLIFSLLRGSTSLGISLLVNVGIFFAFSKLFKFRFNIIEFMVYTLLYYPFVTLFYIIYGGLISTIIKPKLDWVY